MTAKKNNFTFSLDVIKDTENPINVARDYIPFENDGGYSFEISEVRSRYRRTLVKFTARTHVKCTKKMLTEKIPRVFFCINESTGNIYSTSQASKIVPDDELTIDVEVTRRGAEYPIQVLLLTLIIRVKSVCTMPYSLYRQMNAVRCDIPCAYTGHIVPLIKPDSIQNTYNVTIVISRALSPRCPEQPPVNQPRIEEV